MALYRIGQRVRITNPEPKFKGVVGAEGTVVLLGPINVSGQPPYEYVVDVPTCPFLGCTKWRFYGWELSPLTDPGAERFLESLRKLAREPQPIKGVKA